MSPFNTKRRIYALIAAVAVILPGIYGFHAAGKHSASATAALADSPATAHAVYVDTSYCPDLGTPDAFLAAMDTDQQRDFRRSAQYRIWQKRKRQLPAWRRQYARILSLPQDGQVIDATTFATPKGLRTIVAWMTELQTGISDDATYTCPQVSQGLGYFHGRLNFSLVDVRAGRLLNTIHVKQDHEEYRYNDTVLYNVCEEHLDYPFSIANPRKQSLIGGLYYAAIGGTDSTDGEAQILHLRDFNGDGKAYEFALFRQENCVLTNSTLIGYNEQSDRLKWYDWQMEIKENAGRKTDTVHSETDKWVDHTMRFHFNKAGRLRYTMDYRGRDGTFNRYDLHYDRGTDTYSGTLDMRELPEDSLRGYGWYTVPEAGD